MEACGAVVFGRSGLGAGRGVGELFTQRLELLLFRAEAGFARGGGLWRCVGHEGILLRMVLMSVGADEDPRVRYGVGLGKPLMTSV